MSKKKRRLAAIMFTDIVGYSAMMQKDEEITFRLRERHREVFSRLTAQYEGNILQYFGDGTLSVFPSATSAVECGLAIQRALKQPPYVPLRIGIHSGDITYSEEEAYGDGVNVASRIEALCVPGGMFISEKVYDDIKNHSWLQARPVGHFDLKNIHPKIGVYAVTNEGLTVPNFNLEESLQSPAPALTQVDDKKNKWVAGILAFFFGVFGVHRFYLGQQRLGMIYFAIFLLGIFFWGKLIGALAILGFIDAMVFFFQSKKAFSDRYDRLATKAAAASAQQPAAAHINRQKQFLQDMFHQYWQKGKQAYEEYNHEAAIRELHRAIEISYDDPEAHYLLACSYSLNENAEKAFAHLDAAVAFGMKDFDRIRHENDLAFLRIQPAFEAFAKNGYRLPKEFPKKEDVLELKSPEEADLLSQLNRLEELRERGFLTEEEYRLQRERIAPSED